MCLHDSLYPRQNFGLTDPEAQQLHTYLRWTSIKLDQFDYVSTRAGNPELSVAGASVNSDLVLFYIR